jgi:predicted DsbA family dithiol-disulfide isomerase
LNIAKSSVILSLAQDLSREFESVFDFNFFEACWKNDAGVESFRADLQQARFLKIGRYPTLTFTRDKARGIMITGYRPYDVLVDALRQITNVDEPKTENVGS